MFSCKFVLLQVVKHFVKCTRQRYSTLGIFFKNVNTNINIKTEDDMLNKEHFKYENNKKEVLNINYIKMSYIKINFISYMKTRMLFKISLT